MLLYGRSLTGPDFRGQEPARLKRYILSACLLSLLFPAAHIPLPCFLPTIAVLAPHLAYTRRLVTFLPDDKLSNAYPLSIML